MIGKKKLDEYVTRAREMYAKDSDDDIEIDDTPAISVGDGGLWVAAWVWVPDEEPEELHTAASVGVSDI